MKWNNSVQFSVITDLRTLMLCATRLTLTKSKSKYHYILQSIGHLDIC